MRILITIILLLCILLPVFASDFVHPLDFKGSDPEKKIVISFIKANVKNTYSKIGMDDPITLRMMEEEELKNFKQLTKVKNRILLDRVIKQYCAIGMCNYNTIFMMYQEQLKASKKSLSWD